MAMSPVSGQESAVEGVQEGTVTVTVEAAKDEDDAAATEEDESSQESGDGKEKVKSTTNVTSTITVVTVDDEGNVVNKTFTIDGTGGKSKAGVATGFGIDLQEGSAKGKITLKLPDGTSKTIDLGAKELLGDRVIELQVENKGEDSAGEQARVMRLRARELSEQVRKSLEGIGGADGLIDPEEISEQIRAAMSEAMAGQEEGLKLMRLGRAIVLDGKDIGDQAVRRFEFRADHKAKEGDSSSAAILEKLESIMKRMDKIEADIAELKQAKE
jgi:hypothetical protein